VAYRQLCAVTFAVLGLVTVGCGSGSAGAAASDTGDDQPPANAEQAPNSSSDPVSNSDQAPINPDQPPNDSAALLGGGGNVESQCRSFCDSLDGLDCNGAGGIGRAISRVCSSGCTFSAQDALCASEIAAAIACLAGLNGLCTDAFAEQDAAVCQTTLDAADACDQPQQPPTDGNGPGNGNCSTDGGCACGSVCLTCRCNAADATAQAACGACAAP
jgi:hypothetical protein